MNKMTAQHFVKNLGLIYSQEIEQRFLHNGYAEEFVDEYREAFHFNALKNAEDNFSIADPIVDLVKYYDGSSVHMGYIRFDLKPYEDSNYFYFASFEADLLGLNKNTREIQLVEFGSQAHILYHCAANGSSFLEALLLLADFLPKCDAFPERYAEPSMIAGFVDTCISAAGGEKYRQFYEMMVQ